jgi:hypothetical protein
MSHHSWVRETRFAVTRGGLLALVLISSALFWSPLAGAEPHRGRPDPTAEPKRSYGSIDVIMYQTSW